MYAQVQITVCEKRTADQYSMHCVDLLPTVQNGQCHKSYERVYRIHGDPFYRDKNINRQSKATSSVHTTVITALMRTISISLGHGKKMERRKVTDITKRGKRQMHILFWLCTEITNPLDSPSTIIVNMLLHAVRHNSNDSRAHQTSTTDQMRAKKNIHSKCNNSNNKYEAHKTRLPIYRMNKQSNGHFVVILRIERVNVCEQQSEKGDYKMREGNSSNGNKSKSVERK